jgi:hypothetical protein
MTTLFRHVRALDPSFWIALFTLPIFLWPGIWLVRDLGDPAMHGPGIPARAHELHRRLTPDIEAWADERVQTGRAAEAMLHDVPTTEWPMFTAVFYLMATDAMVADWEASGRHGPSPLEASRGAVSAAKDLILDPAHHTWVRTHWGPDYMHQENVFFRSLIIAGLTSYERLTHDGTTTPLLRDQVETLAAALDASELGVLEDYPYECYPIDVLAAVGFIQRADSVLGTDHSAFVARSRRAFEGPMADRLGLVPFRMELPSGRQLQPSRGIGNSWVLLFVPDLWGQAHADEMYGRYEDAFYQRSVWVEGFREFARSGTEPEWGVEVDAGPIIDGFGTSASAFAIAAARRNGRFDHAFALSAELSASSWMLPGGTLALPRAVSHAADAPYLGETAIMYFLTVQPAADAQLVPSHGIPALAWIGLFVFFGVPLAAWGTFGLRMKRRRAASLLERDDDGETDSPLVPPYSHDLHEQDDRDDGADPPGRAVAHGRGEGRADGGVRPGVPERGRSTLDL